MHTLWGLRRTTDGVYTVDPYGNVCTMLQGRSQPSYARLPQDTKFSEDQEKFVWKDWPFVKGIPRTEATVKGIYYQDWMYGHIYQINDDGVLEYKKELSPVNSHTRLCQSNLRGSTSFLKFLVLGSWSSNPTGTISRTKTNTC